MEVGRVAASGRNIILSARITYEVGGREGLEVKVPVSGEVEEVMPSGSGQSGCQW